jgi:methyl-accepting chemotaxis protein
MEERFQAGHKIKRNLILLVGSALLLSGIVISAALMIGLKKIAYQQAEERGIQIASHIADDARFVLASETPDPSQLQQQLLSLARSEGLAYLFIFDQGGNVLAQVKNEAAVTMLEGEPIVPRSSSFEPLVSKRRHHTENFFDLIVPIVTNVSSSQEGWVRIGISLQGVDESFRQLVGKVFLLLIVLTALGVWGTLLFARSLETPLKKITEMAHKIGQGDLSPYLEQAAQEELSRTGIGEGLYQMIPTLRSRIKPMSEVMQRGEVIREGLYQMMLKMREGISLRSQLAKKMQASIETINSEFQRVLERVNALSLTAQTTTPALIEMGASTVQVADNMSNLASYVEDTASALLQMSSSIKQVVDHINALTDNMSDTTASSSRMNTAINEIENNANEAAVLTEKVSKDAEELAGGAIEKTIEGMDNIKKAVEKSSSVIYKLGERTEYIGKILTVIDEVTRQTNLLALNAAILAAQAGEHGRGFAVVADEIKGLADRTATSTKEIAQLIRDLQSEAQDAVSSIREGGQSVEEGVRLSLDARKSLRTILDEANKSSSMSRQIQKATLAHVQANRMVTQSMDKINQMVHQINTAMQEQGKVIEHITEGSERMRLITRQVKSATEEQASGSKQTSSAIEEIAAGIAEIGEGMTTSKKEAEEMTKWTVETDESADHNKKLGDTMILEMENFVKNERALKAGIDGFKI